MGMFSLFCREVKSSVHHKDLKHLESIFLDGDKETFIEE